MDTNMQNAVCLGKIMSTCKATLETQFAIKLSNSEAELKKCVA